MVVLFGSGELEVTYGKWSPHNILWVCHRNGMCNRYVTGWVW